jgi:hypothetical protein
MDFRYLIIRRKDFAILRVDTLTPQMFKDSDDGYIFLIDLATTTEYTKSGKWKSIKYGQPLKNKNS